MKLINFWCLLVAITSANFFLLPNIQPGMVQQLIKTQEEKKKKQAVLKKLRRSMRKKYNASNKTAADLAKLKTALDQYTKEEKANKK